MRSETRAAVLALGTNFPVGLCGGSVANAMGGPLLLATSGQDYLPDGACDRILVK